MTWEVEAIVAALKASKVTPWAFSILAVTLSIFSVAARWRGVSYLELQQQAKSLLAPYVGQPILDANGKPVILNGSAEKYFEATEAQRQNQYGNTLLGQLPNVSISPGMQVRDQERLASLGAKLGSVVPDYIIEETLLGGRAAKMLADVAGT